MYLLVFCQYLHTSAKTDIQIVTLISCQYIMMHAFVTVAIMRRLRQKCHGLSMKWGYVDACFSISICYCSWRQGSSCPLFYINTWAMISGWLTDYPALAGEVLWRKKIFSSCELEMCAAQTLTAPQRVALTAWQSHRQSQWHPSSLSLSPGRMILVCLSIHADTSTSMTYMQIQQRYIQIQIH